MKNQPNQPTRKSARLIDAAKDKEKAEIREWAKENMNLLPSPNQQTRQKRDESNTPYESNSVERARIARIIMDCSELEYVPCSVYGRDCETKYPAHFFCSRCKKADDEETPGSSRVINRLAEGGRYRCTANHTNWYRPTHLNDKSKHLPEAPPSSLFCVPIEDRPVAPPPPPPPAKTMQKETEPKSLEDIMFAEQEDSNPPNYQAQLIRETVNDIENIPFRNLSDCSEPVPEESNEDNLSEDCSDDESLDDLPPWPDPQDDELDKLDSIEPLDIQNDNSTDDTEQINRQQSSQAGLSDGKRPNEPSLDAILRAHKDKTSCLSSQVTDLLKSIEQYKTELEETRRKLKNKNEELRYWKRKDFEQTGEKLPRSAYYAKGRKRLVDHIRYVLESRTQNMEATSRAAGEFFSGRCSIVHRQNNP